MTTDRVSAKTVAEPRTEGVTGLAFAVLAGVSFGLAGALGRGLHDAGWSPAATIIVRVLGGFAVLAVPGALALHGRWELLRRNVLRIAGFGTLAVAATQLCYFYAVTYLSVGVALLIEYLSPVVIVVWLWVSRGRRPSRRTVLGAGLAVAGLMLVLDVFSGATISLPGLLWALAATGGSTAYFLLADASDADELPPLTLAAAGLLVGGLGLSAIGAVGVLPLHTSAAPVHYGGHAVQPWIPLALLAVVTAAVPYAAGVIAVRLLGSRLTSFVMLTEVLSAVVFAWLLLAEVPRPVQLLGGLVLLGGVILVKLGERTTSTAD